MIWVYYWVSQFEGNILADKDCVYVCVCIITQARVKYQRQSEDNSSLYRVIECLVSRSVQFSRVQLCDPLDCRMLDLAVPHQFPELAQTHFHRISDAIHPSHPLSSPPPPAFNLSHHQGIWNESALCIRWPKYWSFSFNISPCNEYSGLISLVGLVGSPCSLRDSQQSSPTPQFKSKSTGSVMCLVAPRHVESFWIRNRTHVPCISRHVLSQWTTREAWDSAFLTSFQRMLMLPVHGPNFE